MGVTDRIRRIIEYKRISSRQFCLEVGIANGYLDKVKDVGSEKLLKILKTYPEINPEWLLTGNGPMLRDTGAGSFEVTRIHTPPYPDPEFEQTINLYDINAAANLQTLFEQGNQNIIGKISIPNLPRCDGAVYLRGDSMYPLLKSGDIIIYKVLNNIENLTYGEMYLIDYAIDGDDYLAVKYINASEIEHHVLLVSYNPHFSPMDIPLSAIRSLAIVKASVRINTMI